MQVNTTIGPENSTRAVIPFITATGAMARGDAMATFSCSGATYFGSENHVDASGVSPPSLGSVAEALELLTENVALEEYVLCRPCADTRGLSEDDLAPARTGLAPTTWRGKPKKTNQPSASNSPP